MKTAIKISKRKRIKTRKSLNEIRKRSRQLINHEAGPTKAVNEMRNYQKSHQFVTSKRLTIAMFPNAVQSETVTRFGKDDVKKKANFNFKDLIQPSSELNINTELVNSKCSESDNNSNLSNLDGDQHTSNENIDCLESREVVNNENNVVEALFHSTNMLSLSDSSPPANCTNDKYHLYEQFMSEISVYLKQTITKSLLKEDFIDNLKEQLPSMKIQSSSNGVTLKRKLPMKDIHISNLSKNMVVENPMDYIKLNYSGVQNSPAFQRECSSSSSKSGDSLLHMCSPQIVLSSFSRTDLTDTPEYIYFPHKLT